MENNDILISPIDNIEFYFCAFIIVFFIFFYILSRNMNKYAKNKADEMLLNAKKQSKNKPEKNAEERI